MSKRLSLIFYTALGIFGAMLLFATVFASFGRESIWHSAWLVSAFLFFAAILTVSVVVYSPKKSIYSIGFYLLHAGIVFFLSGMLIYTLFGHSVVVSPPSVSSISSEAKAKMLQDSIEIPNGYYNQIPAKNGGVADIGFNFRITDFVTEYYNEKKTEVKHYEATLAFWDGDSENYRSLTVNHPIYKNGWKIYLMSVSQNAIYGYDEIALLFKRDPGEILSTAGIVLSLIGVFAMCMPLKRKAMKVDD